MSEWKLFTDEVAPVSTFAFHEHRERAPHLEQAVHRGRLLQAESFVLDAVHRIIAARPTSNVARVTVSDLGCGDGGLLQRLGAYPGTIYAHGYDFQPSNAQGWFERGVTAESLDVFGGSRSINPDVQLGQVVVTTEVLEHLTQPHAVVQRLYDDSHVQYVVASSPATEHAESHDECHAWAWDEAGYRDLFQNVGFVVLRHERVGMFQVILAGRSE